MSDRYEPPFTVADHTKLVEAILARPLHVIKYLDIPKGQPPTTLQVLDAALQVRSFDTATKARLQEARAGYLEFEEQAGNKVLTERRGRVHAALEGKSVPEMIAALDHLLAEEGLHDDSTAGIKLAREILVDGADSIYSPDSAGAELMDVHTHSGTHGTGTQQVAQADASTAAALAGLDTRSPIPISLPVTAGVSAGTAIAIIVVSVLGS
jgi:hypothetical protein